MAVQVGWLQVGKIVRASGHIRMFFPRRWRLLKPPVIDELYFISLVTLKMLNNYRRDLRFKHLTGTIPAKLDEFLHDMTPSLTDMYAIAHWRIEVAEHRGVTCTHICH